MITNLADELPLVDRMRDALHGEVVRRQELLRAAGNYASLRDYTKARAEGARGGGGRPGAALPPVPSLFVVLDEFSELLAAKPEFIDLFVTIGRVGRSLGVHLLLASQRLEEGRLRGLDTQLSYRIGLRTFSAQESRTVLGVPDAYELPSQPGNGYLKDGTSGLTRFKAAYVSGSLTTAADDRQAGPRMRPGIARFGPGYIEPQFIDPPAGEDGMPGPVARTARTGEPGAQPDPARRRGEPALRAGDAGPGGAPDMAAAAGRAACPRSAAARAGRAADAARRARDRGPALRTAPRPAVGRPVRQRRARGGGRAPRSGKSTVLLTLISSLALAHTPAQVQFYILDFGRGSMGALGGLPHVGGVASRLQGDRVRRTVAEVRTLLEQREREFSERGIDSIATYRSLRAEGAIAGDGFGDVFLVVERLAHPAPGLRRPRANRHRAGGPGARLRRPPGGRDQQVVGVPPGRPRPVRDASRTAPR